MELKSLKFFCITAELEHVSKAADKLGVAQPYLTKVIGQIEEELGGKLFDKAGRRIKLNENGEIFYKHAKNVLAAMDKMYAEMAYVFEKKSRMITLMCNTEVYTPTLIVEFQRKNANYGIKVSYAPRKEMIEALKNGDADFALCDPPIEEYIVPGIRTEIVCRDVACALLPPGHPYVGGPARSFADFTGDRLITNPKGGAMRSHVDLVSERHDLNPRIVCETNDPTLLIKAVESGLGYAYLSHISLLKYPELRAQCVDIDSPDNFGFFGLSYNESAIENRAMEDFKNFTVSHFKELQQRINEEFPLR